MILTFENATVVKTANLIHALSLDLELIKRLQAPTIRDFAAAPVIDDWYLGQRLEPALVGRVNGHPIVADGPVVSSGLYYLDPVAGYARTLSRWYRLGTPHASQQAAEPYQG